MNLINTTTAGKRLGITRSSVRHLIRNGKLPAQLIGRDYVINEADLELVKERKRGRRKGYNLEAASVTANQKAKAK